MNPIKEGLVAGIAVVGMVAGYIGGIYLGDKACKLTTKTKVKVSAKYQAWKHRDGQFIAANEQTSDIDAKQVDNVVVLRPA